MDGGCLDGRHLGDEVHSSLSLLLLKLQGDSTDRTTLDSLHQVLQYGEKRKGEEMVRGKPTFRPKLIHLCAEEYVTHAKGDKGGLTLHFGKKWDQANIALFSKALKNRLK